MDLKLGEILRAFPRGEASARCSPQGRGAGGRSGGGIGGHLGLAGRAGRVPIERDSNMYEAIWHVRHLKSRQARHFEDRRRVQASLLGKLETVDDDTEAQIGL